MPVTNTKNTWGVDITYNGERYRKKSPENSKPGAQAYEAQLRHKLAIGGADLAFPKPDKKQKEQEQTFKEFAWKWWETYVRSNNKPSDIANKKVTLRKHLVPFFGETPIDKISSQGIELYKAKKVEEGLAKQSINCHLAVLSSCLYTAKDWLELKTIPRIKRFNTPPPETDFLSHQECAVLLVNSGVWHDIILTALHTGLRRGELIALTWPDINWNNQTLTVRHTWCNHKKGLTTPKSNRKRHIPITDEVYKILLKHRQASGFVFRDGRSRIGFGEMLHREIGEACKRAGIKKISCHTLRHTFASHLAMAGATLISMKELMGHSDIKTTMRYAHLSPSTLSSTVRLLETAKSAHLYSGQYMVNGGQQQIAIP